MVTCHENHHYCPCKLANFELIGIITKLTIGKFDPVAAGKPIVDLLNRYLLAGNLDD